MEFMLLVTLILFNGALAMSEVALLTARRARLVRLAEDGDRAAALAVTLGAEPTRFLSTIQIGITSIGILNGIVGEAVFAAPLAGWLQSLGLDAGASLFGATALVVVTITYVSIVVGELVPKRLGQLDAERMARRVARPIHVLAVLTRPFVRLLSLSTDGLLRVMGLHAGAPPQVTEEEIHAMLAEGSQAGIIERQEHQMLRNVFRLDDRQLGSLMIPHRDIVYLDLDAAPAENMKRVAESDHSRFPVCRGGLHEVVGIINAKQLLDQTLKGGPPDLAGDCQPAVFVPETLTGMELLEQFRASGTQMVLVVDEYGEVQGLVTLQDVMEAVTGEFTPRNQEDAWALRRDDGSWLLDGLIPIPELKDRLELKDVPEEDKGRYHTLSGMMLVLLGRLARTGDRASWAGWRLEVVDLDGKRIDKVLATPVATSAGDAEGGAGAPPGEAGQGLST